MEMEKKRVSAREFGDSEWQNLGLRAEPRLNEGRTRVLKSGGGRELREERGRAEGITARLIDKLVRKKIKEDCGKRIAKDLRNCQHLMEKNLEYDV